MRTLRLADVAEGIDATFAEVSDLADQCKFRDCQHESEPGCAIQAAIARGEVDAGRLERWKKLKAEDRRHSETLAEYHARVKGFGKLTRKVQRDKQRLRGLEEGD
jgi:ribosome biogenesis GTPase